MGDGAVAVPGGVIVQCAILPTRDSAALPFAFADASSTTSTTNIDGLKLPLVIGHACKVLVSLNLVHLTLI